MFSEIVALSKLGLADVKNATLRASNAVDEVGRCELWNGC